MKSRFSTLIKFFIGWPLSLLALFFIGKFVIPNLPKIFQSITSIQWPLLVESILCFLAYFFLRALLWQYILKYKNQYVSFLDTAYLWGVSEIKRYIPGNVWSIVGRTHSFSKKSVKHTTTLSGWAIESEYILLGGGLVSIFSIPFLLSNVLHISNAFVWTIFSITLFFIILGFILGVKVFDKKIPQKFRKFFHHIFPYFSFWENMTLLSISSISFFFLGIGTYISIASIALVPLNNIWIYSSFFVLAMIVGYASFITPMGLGVREAIVTAGLTPLFPLSVAGFLAFFARLILIGAEVLFLAIVKLLYHFPKKIITPLGEFVVQYKYEMLLSVFIFLYVAYFTTASFLRYTNFYTGRFDLGNMDQTVWNSTHGRLFTLTNPDGTNIISRLSVHADFLLVLLAPFYLIWQDPRMLLFIQTVVIALGAIFVYLLAIDIIKNKPLATLLSFLYLLYPAIQHVNLYDFHAVALATTFFLGAFYFLQRNKQLWFVIFLLLAALTKEETWLITALFGIYAVIIKKQKILGASIFLISLFTFWYIFFKAIPLTRGGQHFALAYYTDFGTTPSAVMRTIILSPGKTLSTMFAPDRLEYLKQLLLPLGFLPIVGLPFLIFAFPDLLVNLLSSNPPFHQIYYQYSADLTPFFFIALIYAVYFLNKKIHISLHILGYFLLFMGLAGGYFFGPLPGERLANLDMFTKQLSYAPTIDEFLDSIPAKYSIAATNNVGSHLSHRQLIYTIPTGINKADVVVFLLNDKNAQPSLPAQKQMAAALTKDPTYVELFREQDFVAFAKKDLNFQKRLRKEEKYFPFLQKLLRKFRR